MKFNWGTGIGLFYLIFASVLIFSVIQSTKFDNSLVADNYYEQDIKYQSHYEKLDNSQLLSSKLVVQYDQQSQLLQIEFPNKEAKGTIHLFRPSTSKLDKIITIQLDENRKQLVATDQLKEGLWRLKIDWEAEGRQYFNEESIVL